MTKTKLRTNQKTLVGISDYSRFTTSNYVPYNMSVLRVTDELHPRVNRFYIRYGGTRETWEFLKIKLGLEKSIN